MAQIQRRILLIEPPFYRLFKDNYSLDRYPLSLGYLSGTIKKAKQKLDGFVKKEVELKYIGAYRIAIQEYVEAVCFYSVIVNGKLPGHKTLGAMPEHYLLGLCDLTGELSRRATNLAIAKEVKKVEALIEKKLTTQQADQLISESQRIIDLIKK